MATEHTGRETVTIDEHDIDGRDGPVRVRDYLPAKRTARTAFLWVHGGAFAAGGLDQKESDAPARALAASGISVRTVDYRLAPAVGFIRRLNLSPHPGRFPAGLNDVVDAAISLAEREGDLINIGGASAGANIAAAATLRFRDEGKPLPRSLTLAYGAFHAILPPHPKIESELRGPLAKWLFNPSMLRKIALNYVGQTDQLVPGYAFPGGADLVGFPRTLIMDAANDRLRISGETFAGELRTAGTTVHDVVVGSTHGFLDRPRNRAFTVGVNEMRGWLAANDG